MKPRFQLRIVDDDHHHLAIRSEVDIARGHDGHTVTPDGGVPKDVISRLLLEMLAEAYEAGYLNGTDDCVGAVQKVHRNFYPPKPQSKISETIDWNKK